MNRTSSPGCRSILGAAAAAISTGTSGLRSTFGQTRGDFLKGQQNRSASNPGPINKVLAGANLLPITDRGDTAPIWYSLDLTHRRIQDGGWTRQATAKELPFSRDLAGVTMRLTAGSIASFTGTRRTNGNTTQYFRPAGERMD